MAALAGAVHVGRPVAPKASRRGGLQGQWGPCRRQIRARPWQLPHRHGLGEQEASSEIRGACQRADGHQGGHLPRQERRAGGCW